MIRGFRLAAIVLVLTVIGGTTFGDEPLRDPWKGFGFGSRVTIRKTGTMTSEGRTENRSSTETFEINQIGSLVSVRVINEKGGIGMQMHIDGAFPEEVGLKKAGTEQDKIVIDGKSHPATVTKYVSNPDDPRLELLTKSFPELLKQGGLKGESAVVQLSVWKVKGLNIPYREMSTPGADLALGPTVVRIVHEQLRTDEQGKVVMRATSRRSVQSLTAKHKIGTRDLSCVKELIEQSMETTDKQGSGSLTGSALLSNEVPGRLVKLERSGKQGEIRMRQLSEALSFHSTPEKLDFSLNKLPPLGKRAAIPGKRWGKLHQGGWSMSFVFNEYPGRTSRFGHLRRVVDVRPDGTMVVEERDIDSNNRLEKPSYKEIKREEAMPSFIETKKPLSSGKETLTLIENSMESKWQAYRSAPAEGKPDERRLALVWRPMDVDKKWQTLPHQGAVQSVEYQLSRDSFSARRSCKLSRLIDQNVSCRVNGRDLDCFAVLGFETQGDEKAYQYGSWEITFLADKVPGTIFNADYSIENRGLSYSMLVAWGEYEDRAPTTPQEIATQVKNCQPLVGKAIRKLAGWMNDPKKGKAFAQDKHLLEQRLLELEKNRRREGK